MKIKIIGENYEAGIKQLEQESGGAFEIHVFVPGDMPMLIRAAREGAPMANGFIRSLNGVLEDIAGRKPDNRLICAICDRQIERPGRVGFVVPDQDEFTVAMSFGVCPHCDERIGSDTALLMGELQNCLREIWPDARAVTPTHLDGGRA